MLPFPAVSKPSRSGTFQDRAWWGCLLLQSRKVGGTSHYHPCLARVRAPDLTQNWLHGDAWLVSCITAQRSWGLREGTGSPQHTQQAADPSPKLKSSPSELPLAQEVGTAPATRVQCFFFFFFLATAFLRFNSHTTQPTHSQRTTQGLYGRSQSRAAVTTSNWRTCPSPQKETVDFAVGTPNLAFPRPPAAANWLSLGMCLFRALRKWDPTLRAALSWHGVWRSLHAACVSLSLLFTANIPSYAPAIFCLSLQTQMDIWVIVPF